MGARRHLTLFIGLVLLIAALGVATAGCGGGDEAEEAAPAVEATTEAAATEEATTEEAAPPGEKIEIRVSSEAPIDVDPLPTAVKWEKLAEEATGGQVDIKIFPSAQLFDDTAALDAVASGQLEIVLPTSSRLTGFVEDYAVLDLPFVFTDDASFRGKVEGELGEAMNAKLAEKGMQTLAFWSGGAIVFLNNDGELKRPEEWKGKTIRIFGGDVFEATVEAIGSTPILIPASEVPTAMQQGTADSIITNWDGWEEVFADLVDYGMDPGAWRLSFAVVVNKEFWDGLPEDVRTALAETIQQATDDDWESHAAIEQEAIDNLAAMGKHPYEISEEDRQAWIEATEPVREQFSRSLDPATYELATE